MSFFQNIYGVLFRPNETIERLSQDYNLSVFIQGTAIFILANLIAKNFSVAALSSSLANWLALALFIFLAAYVFVLQGRDFYKLLGVMFYAAAPLMLLAPIKLVQPSFFLLGALFKLAIVIWVFTLQIITISQICKISTAKAILLYFLIPLVFTVILALFLVKTLAGLGFALASLF